MIKSILDKLWKSNNKRKLDGHWYVRLSDVGKYLENTFNNTKNKKISMNEVASHLVNKGWIFERNTDTGDVWKRKVGDYDNREKVN